jgi:hypothetical protein
MPYNVQLTNISSASRHHALPPPSIPLPAPLPAVPPLLLPLVAQRQPFDDVPRRTKRIRLLMRDRRARGLRVRVEVLVLC